jgi:PIN domain nuclease of toxin-antitoxin system
MLNLDTHIFLFALANRLKPKEKKLLSKHPWGISAIVLWEIAKLVQLDRVQLDISSTAFRHALRDICIWPLDLDICHMSTHLDVQSDPADELIMATSYVHNVPLVTRDKKLKRSKMITFPL